MKFEAFEAIDLKDEEHMLSMVELPIAEIIPDNNQPRKMFKDDALQELSTSIKKYGLLQPIIVKKIEPNRYKIIAGERRWRAARRAEMLTISAIIHPNQPEKNVAISLIENIQREALNPVEVAEAFSRLHKEYALSHDAIAKFVGKSRTTVTNSLRLLALPEHIQTLLVQGKLDMGHAKLLMTFPEEKQISFADKLVKEKLSVRRAEKAIQLHKPKKDQDNLCSNVALDWVEKLKKHFSDEVNVEINSKGRGKVSFYFSSVEEGDKLVELILSKQEIERI